MYIDNSAHKETILTELHVLFYAIVLLHSNWNLFLQVADQHKLKKKFKCQFRINKQHRSIAEISSVVQTF